MEKREYSQQNIAEFFRESNAIEGVYGEAPLTSSRLAWDYIQTHEVLTLDILLECHRIIMGELAPNIAGKLRTYAVFVGGREGYPHTILKNALTKWLNQINSEINITNYERYTKTLHIWFEFIHPFADGNGRTGRLVYLWHRQKLNLPIEIIYAKEKQENYYRWFRDPELVDKYGYTPGGYNG